MSQIDIKIKQPEMHSLRSLMNNLKLLNQQKDRILKIKQN